MAERAARHDSGRQAAGDPVRMERDAVWLEGGRSHVGAARAVIAGDGEAPRRTVRLKPFGICRRTVTVEAFARFVADTGYRTDADRFGWSYVFAGLLPGGNGPRPADAPWWLAVDGANWAHPLGPESAAEPVHPVTHISWNDAQAYAQWAGGRLPSEAEWEHAARGGLDDPRYPWGDEEPDDEKHLPCNIWQGRFPEHNTMADGHYGTAPADAFAPNGYGLFNMSGNVWEWCSDLFRVRSAGKAAKARNRSARSDGERLLKGGSYLCHRSYCWRYRIAARAGRSPDTSAGHTGFRLCFSTEAPA